MAKQDASQWPGAISDEERRKGGERSHQRIEARKKYLVEDQRRRRRIQRKVVILDHVADRARDRDLLDILAMDVRPVSRRRSLPAQRRHASVIRFNSHRRFLPDQIRGPAMASALLATFHRRT